MRELVGTIEDRYGRIPLVGSTLVHLGAIVGNDLLSDRVYDVDVHVRWRSSRAETSFATKMAVFSQHVDHWPNHPKAGGYSSPMQR